MPAPDKKTKSSAPPPSQRANPVAEVEKPQKPEWTCEITKPPRESGGYTVGEVFTFSCSGSELSLKEPLTIAHSEEQQYSLVLLKKLELTPTRVSYEATSYRAGKSDFPFVHVVDANNQGFISQPMQLHVASVLPKPPPQTIYSGIGPMTMIWPVWLFFAAFVVVMVLLGWLAVFLKKRIQRKNLEKNIRKFLSPMGSYHQFSKDVRTLRSGVLFSDRHEWSQQQVQNYLFDLNEHFRMFLLREFTVPATTWSSRETQREIKRKAKDSYAQFREPLRKAFQELDRARGSYDQLKSKDCDQLTQIVMKAVDAVWTRQRRGKSA